MKLLDFNWKPSDQQLRQFGMIFLFFAPLLCWFWTHRLDATLWSLFAGLAIAMVGVVRPRILKPIFVVFSLISFPIGLLMSELALLFLFFAILLPIGIIFRLTKRNTLRMRIDRKSTTYWLPRKNSKKPESYFRQF